MIEHSSHSKVQISTAALLGPYSAGTCSGKTPNAPATTCYPYMQVEAGSRLKGKAWWKPSWDEVSMPHAQTLALRHNSLGVGDSPRGCCAPV